MKDWQRFLQLHALSVALLFSLLVHAVILAIKFAPAIHQRIKDNMPALEVILVNAKSQTAPNKAEALAQANLDRGGNTEAERRLKSPLPALKNRPLETAAKPAATARPSSASAAPPADQIQQQREVAKLEQQARELMTQIQARQAVESEPAPPTAAPKPDSGQSPTPVAPSAATLAATSLNAARLEAEISRNWDNYQKRPRRKFIGARAREYRFAAYVEAWRQKVERVGNLNYPEEARTQKLYGHLRMTVNIRDDGSVESIDLNEPSDQPLLNEAAKRIVEMAAPYAAFPADVSRDTDIISITRTWTFTREDTFSSQQ